MLDECRQYLSIQPEQEYDSKDSHPVTYPPHPVTYPHHLATSSIKDNQFLYNARLIDFANIPRTLAGEVLAIFSQELTYPC
jgi:hypothetical protein